MNLKPKMLILVLLIIALVLMGFSQSNLDYYKSIYNRTYNKARPYIQIAKDINPELSMVKDDPKAYEVLAKIRIYYTKHKWTEDQAEFLEDQEYFSLSQLETYAMFLGKYPKSHSALIVKLFMGNILRNINITEGNEILQEIVTRYPDTFEAALATYLLTDPNNYKSIKIIESILPQMSMIDNDRSEYANAMRMTYLRTPSGLFYPKMLSYIAFIYQNSGNPNEAIETYEKIIKDYPKTEYADDAESSILAINE